jgi:cellulose 1,4-beta-cellobiosidase
MDGVQNQNETYIDCGGNCAPGQKCADGRGCMASTDCQSANCVMSVCQPAAMSGLKVQYSCLDPGAPGDRFLQPTFKINNTGSTSVPFSELKIRYWYTQEAGDAPVFQCRGAASPGGCTFVTGTFVTVSPAKTGADHYLEIGFTGTATIAAGQLTDFIDTPVSRVSNFTETGDYSYDGADPNNQWPTFSDHTKITLYRNGTLVWGTEPP